jgi:hypothetical protein
MALATQSSSPAVAAGEPLRENVVRASVAPQATVDHADPMKASVTTTAPEDVRSPRGPIVSDGANPVDWVAMQRQQMMWAQYMWYLSNVQQQQQQQPHYPMAPMMPSPYMYVQQPGMMMPLPGAGRPGLEGPHAGLDKKRARSDGSAAAAKSRLRRPSGENKVCANCGTSDTPFWRKSGCDENLCNGKVQKLQVRAVDFM